MHLKKFSLVPKSKQNLKAIVHLLERRLPESAMFYNMAKLLFEGRFQNRPEMTFEIFAYGGGHLCDDNDETFIFMLMTSRCPLIMVQTSQPTTADCLTQDALAAFEAAIDWTKSYEFNVSGEKFCKFLEEIIAKKSNIQIKSSDVTSTSAYILEKEEALNYEIPDLQDENNNSNPSKSCGIRIKKLTTQDAKIMTKYWYTEGPPERLGFVQEAIETVAGVGVYLDDFEEPATAIVASTIGTLNCLYTLGQFRGKGYAQLAVKFIAKHLVRDQGLVPSAHICEGNRGSLLLFQKLGFIFSNKNYRIRTIGV